jgi:hypothetical protein
MSPAGHVPLMIRLRFICNQKGNRKICNGMSRAGGTRTWSSRWVTSAWLLTEKHFRRIDGHTDLWTLAAILGREDQLKTQPSKEQVA